MHKKIGLHKKGSLKSKEPLYSQPDTDKVQTEILCIWGKKKRVVLIKGGLRE